MVPIPPAKQLHFAYLQPLAGDDRVLGSSGARRGLGRGIPTLPRLSVHVVVLHRIRTEALHRGARPAPPPSSPVELPRCARNRQGTTTGMSCPGRRGRAPDGRLRPSAARDPMAPRMGDGCLTTSSPGDGSRPGRTFTVQVAKGASRASGPATSPQPPNAFPVDRRERRQPGWRCLASQSSAGQWSDTRYPARARIPAHPSQSRGRLVRGGVEHGESGAPP